MANRSVVAAATGRDSPEARDETDRVLLLEGEVARLQSELAQLRQTLAQAERLADEDALAPVANRRAFIRELARQISFCRRYNVASSILYVDLNDMKRINDRLGHAAGDAALMHVARLLLTNVRTSDVVGRLGGDEFAVLLTQADQGVATEKALSLTEIVAATPFRWQEQEISLHIACGAYTMDAQDSDPEAVLAAADLAMYERKRSAKGDFTTAFEGKL